MNKLEELFEKGFYTMAFLRTLACIILLACALQSCGTIEYAYSEANWIVHQIHFQENMDMPNCQFCRDYNAIMP